MTMLDVTWRCATCGDAAATGVTYCRRCGHAQDPGVEIPRDASNALVPTRPPTVGLLVSGAIFTLLLVLTLPVLLVRSVFFSPDDVARSYFGALADRDADRAWGLLARDERGERAGRPLLAGAALRDSGYVPPSNVEVSRLDIDGRKAEVQVRYEVEGVTTTLALELESGEPGSGPLQRWQITNGLLPLAVSGPESAAISVAGAEPAGTHEQLDVFPGGYRVTVASNPLVAAAPVTAVAGGQPVEITPTLQSTARENIEASVRTWLDECGNTKELEPAGCPFSAYGYVASRVSNVSWKITTYPTVRSELTASGQVLVTGDNGQAVVSGQSQSIFDSFPYTSSIAFRGTAMVEDGQIRFRLGE